MKLFLIKIGDSHDYLSLKRAVPGGNDQLLHESNVAFKKAKAGEGYDVIVFTKTSVHYAVGSNQFFHHFPKS